MPSDLDQLKDMGFDPERAALALKNSGNLTSAMDWLEANQDKSLDEIKAAQASSSTANADEEEGPALASGETARSLVCNDCGKKFRSNAQAEFHATKSGHVNFDESTEEIAPLTEEEKKAKLEELRQKLAAKRGVQSEQDKAERKQNEQIRRKATKEGQDIKEALQAKERLKEAQAKKKEKQDEIDARKRALAKIEADKEERRIKAAREKAAREGQPAPISEPTPIAKPGPPKTASSATEARLRLNTPSGTLVKTFPATTTLFEVAHAIQEENGVQVASFTSNFPKKTFDNTDFGMTLKEAGMCPSAALIVKWYGDIHESDLYGRLTYAVDSAYQGQLGPGVLYGKKLGE